MFTAARGDHSRGTVRGEFSFGNSEGHGVKRSTRGLRRKRGGLAYIIAHSGNSCARDVVCVARKDVHITINPAVHAAIQERVESSGDSFSRVIERIYDEATGNLQKVRHDTRGRLNSIYLQAQVVRQIAMQLPTPTRPEIMQALASIDTAVTEIEKLLMKSA